MQKMENIEFDIHKTEKGPPDTGNSKWLLSTRDAGEVSRQKELSCFLFASLFYKKNLTKVEQIRIKKETMRFLSSSLTNSATFTTKKVCFSALYVDILCTKRVENAVEI